MGQELIQCLTWSNRAHKNQQNTIFNLEISLSVDCDLQFHVLYFEALQFENQLELDQAHLTKVGVYM